MRKQIEDEDEQGRKLIRHVFRHIHTYIHTYIYAMRKQIEDEDEQGGKLTGLLLMFPACALLVLEGPHRLVIGSLKMIHVSAKPKFFMFPPIFVYMYLSYEAL